MNTFGNFTTGCLIRPGNGRAAIAKQKRPSGFQSSRCERCWSHCSADTRYWIENKTYPADEIAVRFHHRLVLIHLFPNGNGRHARLIADVVAVKLGRPVFAWGGLSLIKPGEAREKYLQAMRAADAGDVAPLIEFARS